MTDEPSPNGPDDPTAADSTTDELGDSHDIAEAASQHPPPPRGMAAAGSGTVPGSADPVTPGDPVAAPTPLAELPAAGTEVPGTEVPATGPGRPARKHRKANKPHRKAPWWELPALVGLAIVIAILVKTFLVQPFYIPSGSMEKTLHGCPGCAGDRILVSKIIYDFRDPEPGDIVVFNAPPGWDDGEVASAPPSNPLVRIVRGFGQLIGFIPPDGLVLVKRVIAVGGQTVKGDSSGHVFISDKGTAGPYRELDETYTFQIGGSRAKFGPITVPKGRLWVMGDHRDDSADSRYHCGTDGSDGPYDSTCQREYATVPIGNVIGKAVVIAWPPSRWRTLGTPKTFDSASAGLASAGVVPFGMVFPVFLVVRRRRRRTGRRRRA